MRKGKERSSVIVCIKPWICHSHHIYNIRGIGFESKKKNEKSKKGKQPQTE